MNLYRISIIAPILFFVGASSAQPGAQIVGIGANSCSDYVLLRASGGEPIRTAFITWAQGYLSGLNTMSIEMKKPAVNLPRPDTILQVLDKYCEDKKGTVKEAANSIFLVLLESK